MHTPGLDWRWQATDTFRMGLEAGLPLQLGRAPGWIAGGFLAFDVGDRLLIEARVRHTQDTAFQITAGTVAVRWRF